MPSSMTSVPPLAGARVVVFGMARSGVAAAHLAVEAGAADVVCTDLHAQAPVVEGTRAVYGRHDEDDLLNADIVVVSPGVPPNVAPLRRARDAGVPVIGELGLAADVLRQHNVPMLAVTGTNGKSSTVFFLHQILQQCGQASWVGGNLGEPLSNLALQLLRGAPAPDHAVVEVSSYQLETAGPFRPIGAAALNLTPDHLARHGTMEQYAATKMRLFAHQVPGDLAVLPAHDAYLSHRPLPRGVRVARLDDRPGIQISDTALTLVDQPVSGTIDLRRFALPGHHNRQNLAAAVLLATHAGVDVAAIDPSRLQPLPHRLEWVHTSRNGVRWINDSKATNVDSALVGISAMTGPTVFLLGGEGKAGADYRELASALHRRARQVICFGQSGPLIYESLVDAQLPVTLVASLADAVRLSHQSAHPSDTILLSPACASFDAFADFEDRGRTFAALARETDSQRNVP